MAIPNKDQPHPFFLFNPLYKVKCKKPFLPSSIPYLSLNGFIINDESLSLKFNTNCCFGINVECISRKACKQLSFSNRRITNQYYLEYNLYNWEHNTSYIGVHDDGDYLIHENMKNAKKLWRWEFLRNVIYME
ncbi:hypothetical protein Lal_00017753 [Lupinus albus]|nr:hypothetical protein Lal_00017753 [Lupinus albus]